MRREYAIALLIVVLPFGRAFAVEGLPEFKLNNIKASRMWEVQTDIFIPPPSPPVPEPGQAPAFGAWSPHVAPAQQIYPLYRPYQGGIIKFPNFWRTRSGSGGEHGTDNIKFTGRTTVTMDGRNGKAEIKFPEAEFEDDLPGDEVFLFVKASGETLPPELSWAAVICSGTGYLGYKGSSLKLPDVSGTFTLMETIALGSRKTLVSETHPWLAGPDAGKGNLDRLCSTEFRRKMRNYTVKTLPAEMDVFRFKYNSGRNTLNIAWKIEDPALVP